VDSDGEELAVANDSLLKTLEDRDLDDVGDVGRVKWTWTCAVMVEDRKWRKCSGEGVVWRRQRGNEVERLKYDCSSDQRWEVRPHSIAPFPALFQED
jgi:hypothetical protein